MTHAESRALLLELSCGELAPAVAAEVAAHVEACAECLRERTGIDRIRAVTAPLRESEEPPPDFDDRVLAAARAQAQLDHDGVVGQVVEVSGSVKPLGIEAARIDASAQVTAAPRPSGSGRSVRFLLAGAAAAALALAIFVGTSRRERVPSGRLTAAPGEYQIHIRPAPGEPEPVAAPPGPAAGTPAASAPGAAPPPAKAAAAPAATAARAELPAATAKGTGAERRAAGAVPEETAQGPAPEALEKQAQDARHAGRYLDAAALYRSAAPLRAGAQSAAWDLAHAVECLAAAGSFEEASQVREELRRLHPDGSEPIAAADRALREVAPPGPPPGPPPPAAPSPR